MIGPSVPWWGVISSFGSPVFLVGGWTIAAMLQPPRFDPVVDTVSALAATGATDRWFMTLVFLVVGACDAITGVALRPAAPAGRLILVAGGIAGMMVAETPEHLGGSITHAVWAAIGFAALAAWPAGAWRRDPSAPLGLRPAACSAAVAAQFALLACFVAELVIGGRQVGLAERVLGGAQATWPLLVVLSCIRHGSSPLR